MGRLRPLLYSWLGLLEIAAITTLVLVGYSAWAQNGPPTSAAMVAQPPEAQPLGELKAMLARVRLRLSSSQAGPPGSGPARAAAADAAAPVMGTAQIQRDLQVMRSLQTVLIRELAATRDGLKAAALRAAALNREVADLRAQVVSATDELKALRDRSPPVSAAAAPPGVIPAAAVAKAGAAAPARPPEKVIARLDGSVFRSGSAELQPAAAPGLAAAGEFIAAHPTARVRIVGHTDASGDDARNLELSSRRAAAVRDYLAVRFDLPQGRLLAEGRGELEPIAGNDTLAGRQANRRVEIYVRP